MDNSKEYILMCEKAQEMQAGWKPSKGDWYYAEGGEVNKKNIRADYFISRNEYFIYQDELKVGIGRIFLYGNCYGDGYYHPDSMDYDKRIWLPKQDQLQYMLGTKYTLIRWIERFCVWARSTRFDGEISSYSYNFDSFEQFWLAFVMKEKYNKIWRAGEWVKGC